jgi:hypothetical protein
MHMSAQHLEDAVALSAGVRLGGGMRLSSINQPNQFNQRDRRLLSMPVTHHQVQWKVPPLALRLLELH